MFRSQLMNAGPPDPPTPEMFARLLAHLSPLQATARCIRLARIEGGLTTFVDEVIWLIALRSLVEDGSLTPDEAQARLVDGVVAPCYRSDRITLDTIAVVNRGMIRPTVQEAGVTN